ncbi:hypothetical protein ASA1KI_39310 [Opitutales bacterium ASA1]|uniref:Fur family transcriptional regulator n=1 Tax=Congregicoccus parvus TaxID=3081749 RepID=UPI002B30E6DA|nr:hypothetical protein ASA1KI_39310 [Opitutales bacterium ASA1]
MPPNASTKDTASPHAALNEKLGASGLRATRQRELIYHILLDSTDHPSADEVFARAKSEMPSISLATVYNCLETLARCDLVKPVNFEREPTRYCPNLKEHAHFHDIDSGRVFDVELDPETILRLRSSLPRGMDASSIEITFRGSARSARKSAR